MINLHSVNAIQDCGSMKQTVKTQEMLNVRKYCNFVALLTVNVLCTFN